MDTTAIANRLVELCRLGKNFDAMQELYSDDVVSVEAFPMPDGTREFKGKAGVIGKSEGWAAIHEVHDARVGGPLVAEPHFCVSFWFDVTNKVTGQRMQMDELAVYQVADGKIVREEFFYGA
jgi:ketosteroid isomerase-like protein